MSEKQIYGYKEFKYIVQGITSFHQATYPTS